MARHSQNGYTSYDQSLITTYVVSDGGRKMRLRKGSPGELLADFFRWFDREIRNIDVGILDDWSYAERPIRGSTNPDEDSNHASGTAGDVDATKWPLGVQPEAYLTAAEIARVRAKLKDYEGCIRWGGDYTGRKDPMHFEINKDEATCDRVWAKIQRQGLAPVAAAPQEDEDMKYRAFHNVDDGGVWLCAPGHVYRAPDPGHLTLLLSKGVCTEPVPVNTAQLIFFRDHVYLAANDLLIRRAIDILKAENLIGQPDTPPTVDPIALANALLAAGLDVGATPEEIAEAVTNELHERSAPR